jgi:hypothetical protein
MIAAVHQSHLLTSIITQMHLLAEHLGGGVGQCSVERSYEE